MAGPAEGANHSVGHGRSPRARRRRPARSWQGRTRRVPVPLDGSEVGEAAVGVSERICRQDAGDLLLPRRALETRYEKAQRCFQGARKRRARRGIHARGLVRSGDPVQGILACAAAEAVGPIAMTARGRTGPRRVLFGSVAVGVLHLARGPVLLVRGARP